MIWGKALHSISAGLSCYDILKKTMDVRIGLMGPVTIRKIAIFIVTCLLYCPDVCLAWKLNSDSAVEPNKIRIEYEPDNLDNTDLITLHINPQTIGEFHIHQDGNNIFIDKMQVHILWIYFLMGLRPPGHTSNGLSVVPFILPHHAPGSSAGSYYTYPLSYSQYSLQMYTVYCSHGTVNEICAQLYAKLQQPATQNQQPPTQQAAPGPVPPEPTTSVPDTSAQSEELKAQTRKLEEQNKKLETYQRKCQKQQQTLDQVEDKLLQLDMKLSEADKKVTRAEHNIREKAIQIKALELTNSELQKSIDNSQESKTQLSLAQKRVKQLSRQLTEQQQAVAQLKEKEKELQQAIVTLNEKEKELQKTCQTLECYEAEQHQQAEQARKKVSGLQAQINQLKRQSRQNLTDEKEKSRQQKERLNRLKWENEVKRKNRKDQATQTKPAPEPSMPTPETTGIVTDQQKISLTPDSVKVVSELVTACGEPTVINITPGSRGPGTGKKSAPRETAQRSHQRQTHKKINRPKRTEHNNNSNTNRIQRLISRWDQLGREWLPVLSITGFSSVVLSLLFFQYNKILLQSAQLKELKNKQKKTAKNRKANKPGDKEMIPLSRHCLYLKEDSKLIPVCEYLESRKDRNMTFFLPLLENIGEQFKESLTYPRFCWYQWTGNAAERINLNTLVNELYASSGTTQFLLDSVHLQTCESIEFFQESAEQQARILTALVVFLQTSSTVGGYQQWSWKELYDILDKDILPLLLGLVRFTLELERRRQDWEKIGIHKMFASLGIMLLTHVINQETSAHHNFYSTADGQIDVYLIVNLGTEEPFLIPGYFHQEHEGIEKIENLPHHCTTIPASLLKNRCYSYLIEGAYWKARATGTLQDYIFGHVPVLIPDSKGALQAHYPSLTDQDRFDGMSSLISWVDAFHDTASYAEKSDFLLSALALAGFSTSDNHEQYMAILSRLWQMQQENNHWTKGHWAERLFSMDRTADPDAPELTLQPLWRQDQNDEWYLTLKPAIAGQTFKIVKVNEGKVNEGHLYINVKYPNDIPETWISYVWVPSYAEWREQLSPIDEMPIHVSDKDNIDLPCSLAYAFGPSADELEVFFAFSNICSALPSVFTDFLPKPASTFILQ